MSKFTLWGKRSSLSLNVYLFINFSLQLLSRRKLPHLEGRPTQIWIPRTQGEPFSFPLSFTASSSIYTNSLENLQFTNFESHPTEPNLFVSDTKL